MKKEVVCYGLDKGQEYDQNHGRIVSAYLRSGRPVELEVEDNKYKSLDRGEITAFYTADGDTLFNVENTRLSAEAAETGEGPAREEGTKSPEDAEEQKTGKTKGEKQCASGESKLLAEENEMLGSVKPEYKAVMQKQLDLIFQQLIVWTRQNSEFEKKVLLDHKSMKRCMKFCADKAMGLREPTDQEKINARQNNVPIMTPVGSDMLFEWIREYYDADDKAEAEKEKKAAASKKKSADKKKTEPKKTVGKKEPKKKAAEKKETTEKREAPKTAKDQKKQEKEISGQMSMFDLFGE